MAEQQQLAPWQSAVQAVQQRFHSGWSDLGHHIGSQVAPFKQNTQRFLVSLAPLRKHAENALRLAVAQQSGALLPFASMSLNGLQSNRRAQHVFDLAMPKEEVKARLAPIPVYTVANTNNEFVLVTGENNAQIGFFFLNRLDAESLVLKIKEENPRLARDSRVLRVTMDSVYEVFTTPRDQTGLQLFSDAGVPTKNFVGVPVFQADGLTVTTDRMEDMDLAVDAAYHARNAAQIRQYREKAIRYKEEWDATTNELGAAKDDREKLLLDQKAEKAEQKYQAAARKAEEVERAPLPKVEVGCLEEVIMRMSASQGEDLQAWGQVMFVTPGILVENAKKEQQSPAFAVEGAKK